MSYRRTVLLAGAALILLALALSVAGSSSAATWQVNITGYRFVPSDITVAPGDTVQWTHMDPPPDPHDVTFDAGFGSGAGALLNGMSWNYTFNTPGSFRYVCTIHFGMVGSVNVLDTADGPSVDIFGIPAAPVPENYSFFVSGEAQDNVSIASLTMEVIENISGNLTTTVETNLTNGSSGDIRTTFFNLSVNTTGWAPGNYTVRVIATNGTGGNSTAATGSFEIQPSAPPPPPPPPPPSGSMRFIELRNFAFSPQRLTVNIGDTVVFTNNDTGVGHDVTFEVGASSGAIGAFGSGQSWNRTFTSTGTFRYHCVAHTSFTNYDTGMVGVITVIDPSQHPQAMLMDAPTAPVALGSTVTLAGHAADLTGVTAVFVQVDGRTPAQATLSPVVAGDATSVNWSYALTGLLAGDHTVSVWAQNAGGFNSTPVTPLTFTVTIAPAAGGGGPPPGNPFGETFLFEDILSKYFWLIVGVSVILLAVIMMFLSYSGKLQNYYITILTALDERHRLFAFTRPSREFIYTIQRQMPRTHTERYNLKVIWYWYPLYCLGGLTFAAFIIETITGIILGFYYIPEGTGPNEGLPSKAYQSMETIMTKVTFGYIFRALHHWGAHMMVAAVFLHMMRVYFVGAYKNPRELNWLLGVILLNLVLLFGYTGYLLPWDQLSFWAGQIGLEMAYTVPVIGEIIGNMIFGGPELSGATIIRMYYLHVFVLPLVGGALIVLHMGIVWMQGVAEPH